MSEFVSALGKETKQTTSKAIRRNVRQGRGTFPAEKGNGKGERVRCISGRGKRAHKWPGSSTASKEEGGGLVRAPRLPRHITLGRLGSRFTQP